MTRSTRQIVIREARTFYKQLLRDGHIEVTLYIPRPRSPAMPYIDFGFKTRIFFDLHNEQSMQYTVEEQVGSKHRARIFRGRTRVERLLKYLAK